MNDTNWQTGSPMIEGGPTWLTLSFVLIALGVLAALFILWWGTRLGRQRRHAREELIERGEAHFTNDPGVPPTPTHVPPAAPSPPPTADAPLPGMPAVPPEPAPEPALEPAPLADEPIAAAAGFDSSPAALAASEPVAPTGGNDDLTRMKGVGPKLAERLNALGITRFEQIAAFTPEQASALDAQLGNFQGRIYRDRWIEQAGFLAAGDASGYEKVFGKL